jgi:hypothetical protein
VTNANATSAKECETGNRKRSEHSAHFLDLPTSAIDVARLVVHAETESRTIQMRPCLIRSRLQVIRVVTLTSPRRIGLALEPLRRMSRE